MSYDTFNDWDIIPMPTEPSFQTISVSANDAVGQTMSPFTGQQKVQQWPGADFWELDLSLPQMPTEKARPWMAFLMALRGKANVFAFGDPLGATPQGVPSGTPVVNGTHLASATTLNTTGWTASHSGLLLPGDYIGLGVRMHQVINPVNSDGSGHAAIEIWPSLREAVASGVTVNTSNCTALFRLADNKRIWSVTETQYYGISFKAIEAR